ncbi:hypothetical protein GQ457_03G010920 [Hibiscus cannabinus]
MENPSNGNPNSFRNPINGQGTGVVGLSTSGRPPDSVEIVGQPFQTETTDPSLAQGLQPDIERGQREKLVTFLGADSLKTVGDVDFEDAGGHGDNQRPRDRVPSFKDKLIGMNNSTKGGSSIKELDVKVKDEDVRVGGGGELPEIWFSDRVHEAIDAKLAKSIIVRLLGKPIGYRALWNRIHALWNPVGEISLIDLDNEYYLVRFAIEDNFHKVLSGGPWVIYGSYLTVQPWSRHFKSEEDHPSHIMVWVHLPKLPYRYYTKSLFKYIAATIGDVVRVDYNTEEGKRGRFARLAIIVDLKKPLISGIIIDGKRQDIEYEGLPLIFFKCGKYGHMKESCGVSVVAVNTHDNSDTQRNPKELYGPWMQVVNRKRKIVPSASNTVIPSRGPRSMTIEGSRFEVLSQEQENVVERVNGSLNAGILDREVADVVMDSREVNDTAGRVLDVGKRIENVQREYVAPKVTKVNVAGTSTERTVVSVKLVVCVSVSVGARTVALPTVAARVKVVAVDSTLHVGRHSAVRVVNDDGRAPKSTKERILPASIRGSKARVGSKVRLGVPCGTVSTHKTRKEDTGVAHSTVADHLTPLVRELDKAAATEKLRVPSPRASTAMDTRDVNWCSNSAFEQLGACDVEFNRSFKLLIRKQRPDIVAIMEPRISGRAADKFIQRSSFEFSYRVEAHGFSGGIWVLWRSTVKLEVLAVSNKFVHALCSLNSDGIQFFVSFVYVSPNSVERRGLWNQLLAIDPGSDKPWVVGGDLNVICNSSERVGGSLRRSRKASRKWSIDVFGHIGKRKAQLLARLNGIDRALESSFRPSLVRLEDKLKRELDEVLAFEESLWHRRSRITWTSEGNRNTSFYHMISRNRREHNTVRKLRVENDEWYVDAEALKSHVVAFFKGLFTSDGVHWDWRRLEGILSRESIERIASVQPPRSDSGEDQPFWRWESNGQFSARSAYGYLISDTASGTDMIWKNIWKLKVPHRVRMFAWLVWHERLLNNAEWVRRHKTTSAHCEICGCRREEMDRITFYVNVLRLGRFGARLFQLQSVTGFFELLIVNGCGQTSLTYHPPWSARGGGEDIIACGNVLVEEARRAFYVNIDTGGSAMEEVCWLRLPIGWIKVNVDAAVSTVEGLAGIGAVFRDDGGSWLFGFARFVGRCTVLVAELWAIHDGLAQAWGRGHRCVELESDNLEAVRLVNSNSNLLHEQGLVLAIKQWLHLEWRVVVRHVPRGKNRVADMLAAKCRRFVDYMPICFATAPDDAVGLVIEDRERSITERVCSGRLLDFPYDPRGDSRQRF